MKWKTDLMNSSSVKLTELFIIGADFSGGLDGLEPLTSL